MKTQTGFTLIEMVAVIIILAIVSATALPKFANLTSEARHASINLFSSVESRKIAITRALAKGCEHIGGSPNG